MADTRDHDHTDKNPVGRRDFFKGAALGAAGLVVTVNMAGSAPSIVTPSPVRFTEPPFLSVNVWLTFVPSAIAP